MKYHAYIVLKACSGIVAALMLGTAVAILLRLTKPDIIANPIIEATIRGIVGLIGVFAFIECSKEISKHETKYPDKYKRKPFKEDKILIILVALLILYLLYIALRENNII